jgi:hypothetical protein
VHRKVLGRLIPIPDSLISKLLDMEPTEGIIDGIDKPSGAQGTRVRAYTKSLGVHRQLSIGSPLTLAVDRSSYGSLTVNR